MPKLVNAAVMKTAGVAAPKVITEPGAMRGITGGFLAGGPLGALGAHVGGKMVRGALLDGPHPELSSEQQEFLREHTPRSGLLAPLAGGLIGGVAGGLTGMGLEELGGLDTGGALHNVGAAGGALVGAGTGATLSTENKARELLEADNAPPHPLPRSLER